MFRSSSECFLGFQLCTLTIFVGTWSSLPAWAFFRKLLETKFTIFYINTSNASLLPCLNCGDKRRYLEYQNNKKHLPCFRLAGLTVSTWTLVCNLGTATFDNRKFYQLHLKQLGRPGKTWNSTRTTHWYHKSLTSAPPP